jgi:hypothetical protein
LLSSGASVDIASCDGTPLHFAAARGKIGVMKVLLEHHADVISKFHAFVSEFYMVVCYSLCLKIGVSLLSRYRCI